MRRVITGQFLLIICCVFYLIWWYRGYRPGASAGPIGGINGVLLFITMAFGFSGVIFSLMPVPEISEPKMYPMAIVGAGTGAYLVLLLVTKFIFHRIVTAELFLIVAWTVLEIMVINRLFAGGFLPDSGFMFLCAVVMAAFTFSMILYIVYYRMEEMKAFYAAMLPLVTEAAAMAVLIGSTLKVSRL